MITDKAKCLVAEKPVTCYKVMRPIDRGGATKAPEYKFRSEHIGYIYTLGESERERRFPDAHTDLGGGRTRVDTGFHSYARKEDACEYINAIYDSFPSCVMLGASHLAMVECEIPAGSRYWEGDEGGYPGYCSDRIRVVAWKPWYGKDWIRCDRGPSGSGADRS